MKIPDFVFFFFCYIQSVNIQNSLCGSRERHEVEKEKRKRKKVSDPVDESLRLAGRRKQNKTKKISTNEFNKIIITESQEEPSCLKLIKHKKKINFCVIFFFTFLNVYVTSTSIHHIISLYPSHDISFKMLHYSYYIKCRTSILSAKHISQRVHLHISVEKKKKNRRAWQKTLTVFSLAFWRGRRVNRDLFRVIRLFTGELHSEKGVLENDRTGFYCRSHTGQRTSPVRDRVFRWWSSGKRTQLAEIRFGLIPEVCVCLFSWLIHLWFLLPLVMSVAKTVKSLKRNNLWEIRLFTFLLRVEMRTFIPLLHTYVKY